MYMIFKYEYEYTYTATNQRHYSCHIGAAATQRWERRAMCTTLRLTSLRSSYP